ncbi:hypothetical protein DPSP01_014644 [Paraphaeosphaeria sporulosa]
MAYREEVERLERGGVNAIGKEHFTCLYSRARCRAFTPRNIRAGFSACGLFPFNPDRVLRGIPKPPGELTIAAIHQEFPADTADPQETLQSPLTPVTPVTTQALVSLQNIIVNRDAQGLDERSKCSLQRHLETFSKAAHLAFSRGILQRDQIRFLMKVNDEAKVRRSTRSEILGTAKVMGFDELEAKRAEREAMKEAKAKAKRVRKRKAPSGAAEGEGRGQVKRGRKRKVTTTLQDPTAEMVRRSEAQVEDTSSRHTGEDELTRQWRAPVAPMLHTIR